MSLNNLFKRLAARYIMSGGAKRDGLRLVFDAETDGLATATKVHCIVVGDLDDEQITEYGPGQIDAALEHLARADCLIGQNILGYDLPLLRRLHRWVPPADCIITDTLVASRLILPDIGGLDEECTARGAPSLGKLTGSHSLEAWGVRLNIPKVGAAITDWSTWTPEMQARCVGDVRLCMALWRFLKPDEYAPEPMALEHQVAPICGQITADGVLFDQEAALRLRDCWNARLAELHADIQRQLPGLNPNSRQQIGKLLEERGWIPEKRTNKTGQPSIDDQLLETIPQTYPEFAGIAEYDLLRRRCAQLVEGKQAWLKHIAADGRIHGGLVHIGTPHSRAKHLEPNLAQVPNPKKGGAYATECRTLFYAPEDWSFVTCDQANLQDRGYAHYLVEFDGGAYARAFLGGADQHWESAIALELVPFGTKREKTNKMHTAVREGAKRFRYAFLFGAGSGRAGRIIYDTARAVHLIDPANGLQQRLFGNTAHPGPAALKRVGGGARDKFMAATPGLRELRASFEKQERERGWLPGLDGRRVPVDAQYKALNYAVTSAEAIICKRWLAQVHAELQQRFRYGWNGDTVIVLWVHDEIAVCCKAEIAEQVGEILVRHAIEAGEHYKFKVPLGAEYKIGRSWAGDPTETPPQEDGPTDAPEPEEEEQSTAEETPEPEPPRGNERDRDDGYTQRKRQGGRLEHSFYYQTPAGTPHQRVDKMRLPNGDKYFNQFSWEGGAWIPKTPKVKYPYRVRELINAASGIDVFITEGELDSDTLAKLELVATTNPGGAIPGAWANANLNGYFGGKRRVFIVEDNDATGRDHTQEIAAGLKDLGLDLRVIAFPELPEHGDVTDWFGRGHSLEEFLERAAAAPKVEIRPGAGYRLHWFDDEDETDQRWLIHGLLPETGCGLISGQWGAYKSSAALDIAATVIAGAEFLDHPVVRNGGVLFMAPEGGNGIKQRFRAVLADKYPTLNKVPFVFTKTSPRLLGKGTVEILAGLASSAAERMRLDFGCELVLIIVDTVAAAAGYAKPGDENDAAVGQVIMNCLAELSRRTGALVLGVDHFGKMAETGTRGTSAKEAAADVILALLGSKEITGVVTNTRLAVRKVREGEAGREIAFTARVKELGLDAHGKPRTAPVIDWNVAGSESPTKAAAEGWTKAVKPLRKALMAKLADGDAREIFPAEGKAVRAIDLEIVRREFYATWPADGTEKAKQEARRKAFNRAMKAAQDKDLVGVRDIDGITFVWLEQLNNGQGA